MPKNSSLILLLVLIISLKVSSQEAIALKEKIDSIVQTKNAVVGIAINNMNGNDTLNFNGDKAFPMQSVFKFHIALTVLSEVDKGTLSLGKKIEIKKHELLPGLWSPLRKKYPTGVTLTLKEIIEYTVALSDNVGCDVLLRLLGGPKVVEDYFHSLGFKQLAIKINEETMQSKWDMQFLNWTTPIEANKILTTFYQNKSGLLSKKSHDFIWGIMKKTKTGNNRLKGNLPSNTVVAHKTGSSGKNKETGITAAVNNIGIVFLPNENHYIISVFVTKSTENYKSNEKIIADISKAAWEYFLTKKQKICLAKN